MIITTLSEYIAARRAEAWRSGRKSPAGLAFLLSWCVIDGGKS